MRWKAALSIVAAVAMIGATAIADASAREGGKGSGGGGGVGSGGGFKASGGGFRGGVSPGVRHYGGGRHFAPRFHHFGPRFVPYAVYPYTIVHRPNRCYRLRQVWTRWGWRVKRVNICRYPTYRSRYYY